jgi:hypothetical protein
LISQSRGLGDVYKRQDMSDHEIDAKIKEKLNRFMGVVDVEDVLEVSDHSLKAADNESE